MPSSVIARFCKMTFSPSDVKLIFPSRNEVCKCLTFILSMPNDVPRQAAMPGRPVQLGGVPEPSGASQLQRAGSVARRGSDRAPAALAGERGRRGGPAAREPAPSPLRRGSIERAVEPTRRPCSAHQRRRAMMRWRSSSTAAANTASTMPTAPSTDRGKPPAVPVTARTTAT